MIIKKIEAEKFEHPGIVGTKYHIETLMEDKSFVYGELKGEHGERTSTETPRLYYVIDGNGKVEIDGDMAEISTGDLVMIPPKTKYNYWSKDGVLKFILFMEMH